MGKDQADSEVEDSIENTADEVPSTEEDGTEPQASVDDLISKIISNDNVGAKQDFESIIASKLDALLDTKKQELAQALYRNNSSDEAESEEVEQEE